MADKQEPRNDKGEDAMAVEVDSILGDMMGTPEVNTPVTDDAADLAAVQGLSDDSPAAVEQIIEDTEKPDQQPHSPTKPSIIYKDREKKEEPVVEEVVEEFPEEAETEGEIIEYVDEDNNPVNKDGTPLEPEVVETAEELSEVEALREQVAALQGTLNMSAQAPEALLTETPTPEQVQTQPAVDAVPQQPQAPATPQTQAQPVQSLAPAPLTEEVMEAILEGGESGRDTLAGYVNQAVQIARQQTLREIAPMINNFVEVRTTFEAFFNSPENSDLLPMIDYVKKRAAEIEVLNPTAKLPDLLKATAKDVREKMGMLKGEEVVSNNPGEPRMVRRRVRKVATAKNGGVAPGTRARRQVVVPTVDKNSIEAQIESMMPSN